MSRPLIALFVLAALLIGYGTGHFVGSRPVASKPPAVHSIAKTPRPTAGAVTQTKEAEPPKVTTLAALREALQNAKEPYELAGEIKLAGGTNDFAAALRLCEEADNANGVLAIAEICGEWAKTDPQAAIAYSSTIANQVTRRNAMLAVIGQWVDQDFAAAAAYVKQLPPGALRNQASQELPGKLAESDPRAALSLIAELRPTGYSRESMFQSVFSAWSQHSPAEAASAAMQLGSAHDARSALTAALDSWAEQDLQRARQWVEALPESLLRNQAYGRVVEELATSDPAAAAQLAAKMTPGQLQYSAMSSIAMHWAGTDLQAALAWVQQLPAGRGHRQAQEALMNGLVQSDPETAADLLGNVGSRNEYLTYQVASTWANVDLGKATQWALQLPAGAGRLQALQGVCEPMVQADPQQALQFVLGLHEEDGRSELLGSVISSWAEQDPQGARGWTLNLTDKKMRETLLPDVFGNWASDDPDAAIAAAARLTGPEQNKVATSMAYSLGADDPARAVVWAMQFPNESLRAELVSPIASQWAARDIDECTRWAETLLAGPVRDTAVYALASQLARDEPADALRWAETLQDQEKGEELIATVLEQWRAMDREAAERWLANSRFAGKL